MADWRLAAVLLVAGCSSLTSPDRIRQATVDITAPPGSCWTATVVETPHTGCGSASFPARDALGLFSSSVRKTSDGFETVKITVKSDGKVLVTGETATAQGVAQVIVPP